MALPRSCEKERAHAHARERAADIQYCIRTIQNSAGSLYTHPDSRPSVPVPPPTQINGNTPMLHEPTPRLSNGQKATARASQVRHGAENDEMDAQESANSSTTSPTNSPTATRYDHLLKRSQKPVAPKLDFVRDSAAQSASRRMRVEANGSDRDAGDASNVRREGVPEECQVAASVLRLRSRMCVAEAQLAAWSSGGESDEANEKRRGGVASAIAWHAHARIPRTWTPETPPPERASRSLSSC